MTSDSDDDDDDDDDSSRADDFGNGSTMPEYEKKHQNHYDECLETLKQKKV
jgi:hypothetical protein